MFSGGIEIKYGNENGLISYHIRMFMFLGGCIPSLPLLSEVLRHDLKYKDECLS